MIEPKCPVPTSLPVHVVFAGEDGRTYVSAVGTIETRLRGLSSSPPGECLYLITNFEIKKKIITARKRSCGKVMFLHPSVILFTGGLSPGGGISVREMFCTGSGSLSRGISVQQGGLCSGGGSLSGGGLCRGISVREAPIW